MLKTIRKLIINRSFTTAISFIIDNLVPPIIRDNRYFMYPFYYLAFKGRNIKENMEFKAGLYSITNEQLEKIYNDYQTIGTERTTDLNRGSIRCILKYVENDPGTILDVGCGKGYMLSLLHKKGFRVTGTDVFDKPAGFSFDYVKSNAEKLPFGDNSFDIVVSTHTLEHVIDVKSAVNEMKRVARKMLIVVVPCQRFNYYTLDHHLHFFPKGEMLEGLMQIEDHEIKKVGGDWVYAGSV
ncbi:MAG: class I SAM-dependent methyltransferase [Bacteroidales bacterium]|nr:class I SAM-dependent methyltransferase [Bacteroidales bacterium]